MDFKQLNKDLYQKSAHYRFAKKPDDFDRGYLKLNDWLNELCWYYISREKDMQRQMDEEFRSLVKKKEKKISELKESAYKQGLKKAVEDLF